MNLQERALSVLGCKFADDVLIGAPPTITREMLSTLRVDVVLRFPEDSADGRPRSLSTVSEADRRYEVPADLGILRNYRRWVGGGLGGDEAHAACARKK